MDLKKYFQESADVKVNFIKNNADKLEGIINLINEAIKNWNKVLICGNGWSAADSQHFAAEFLWQYKMQRNALPAIALSTDTSILTAIWNDYGFDIVFSRQVEWLWKPWDILVWISTSWNSMNVIKAVESAKAMWIKTIGLVGKWGWKLKDLMDYTLIVPSDNTPRIQECHETIYHTICEEVEIANFKNN